ncbi:MAG: glycosyltransferase family 39 protein [Caldilineaceae bacterium]
MLRSTAQRSSITAHAVTSPTVSPAASPSSLRITQRLLLLLLLLAAFALRLQELTRQNIWWDEARNIDVALRPFLQIATAPELDIHPPVYFWLLHLWLAPYALYVGDAPVVIAFLARMLSVSGAMLATALLFPVARLCKATNAGLIAVMLAALAPFWLAESQETRMYTVGFALLTAAAYFLLKVVMDQSSQPSLAPSTLSAPNPPLATRHSPLRYAPFIILAALALLTHYNAVFILVAWYGWWALWVLWQPDRWRQLRTIFLVGLVMTALVAPVTPIALRQIPTYANPNLVVPSLRDYLQQNWQAYIGGYAYDPAFLGGWGNGWLWAVLVLLLTGLLLYFWVTLARSGSVNASIMDVVAPLLNVSDTPPQPSPEREGSRSRRAESTVPPSPWVGGGKTSPPEKLSRPPATAPLTLLLVWLFGGLGLYYIAVLDRGAFNVRYSSFITPALYLLLGLALSAWGRLSRWLAVAGVVAVAAGLVAGVQGDLYDTRFAREDIAGVTAWLRSEAGPDDLILVDQKYPFGFYYQRYAIAPEVTPTGEEAAPARYLFVDINTLDQRLNAVAGRAQRVFWVQWFESDTDPRHAVRFLLNKAGVQAGERDFQGYSVDWWQLTPPTHFELASSWSPLQLRFADAVQTVELSLPATPIPVGGKVPVVIRWQRVAQGNAGPPLKARVALYDAQDSRLVQSDERLLNDRHLAPAEWHEGDQPLNVYLLELPSELGPGRYTVRLLVYLADTLEPLTLIDEAGNPAGIEAPIGEVELSGQ